MSDLQLSEPKLSQYSSEESEIELGLNDESTTAGDDMFLENSPKENTTLSDQEDNTLNNFSKKKYCMISQEIREQFIERVLSKKTTIKQAAIEFGIKFSTSKAILQTYKKEGRIGKKKTRNRKKKEDQEDNCCEGVSNETNNQLTNGQEMDTFLTKRSFPFEQQNFLSHQVKQIKIDEKSSVPVVQSQSSNNSIQNVLQSIITNQILKQTQQQQQQQNNEQIMKALIMNAMKQKLMQQEQQKQEILKQIFLANLIKKNQNIQQDKEAEKTNVNSAEILKLIIQQQIKNRINLQNSQNSSQKIEEESCQEQDTKKVENVIDGQQKIISESHISQPEQNNTKLKQKKIHIIQFSGMKELQNVTSQLSLFSDN